MTKLYREREKHRIASHYKAELQTAKQNLTNSKNLIEFSYGDFPCHQYFQVFEEDFDAIG